MGQDQRLSGGRILRRGPWSLRREASKFSLEPPGPSGDGAKGNPAGSGDGVQGPLPVGLAGGLEQLNTTD